MSIKILLLRGLRKFGILNYLNLYPQFGINGAQFKIPILQGIGLDNLTVTEEWMTTVMIKLFKLRQGGFVDIGVNLGQTLLKLKSIHPEIEYIGFEPNPRCILYVNELVRLNDFARVRLVPAGIYSFDGIAQLSVDSKNPIDSCGTLVREFRSFENELQINVPVISSKSLQKILNEELSIVKIDVEGAELDVLEQLTEILRSHRPFIICEILPCYSKENTYRVTRKNRIESLMKELNYQIAAIKEGFNKIDSIPINNSVEDSNYLFYPVELKELI